MSFIVCKGRIPEAIAETAGNVNIRRCVEERGLHWD
jgi:hypothetical protein